MKTFHKKKICIAISAVLLTYASASQAVDAEEQVQEQVQELDKDVEIISVLGSRSNSRTVEDSPVAVDVISGETLNSLGNSADMTDNLKALVPSFTATPSIGDGSAFVRSTSLRGMASDQTLVLVNGKRRHRSSLIQLNAPAAGNGAHGSDIGMIPGIAISGIDVLRDGAAAQYGSDAIAGVINFNIKNASEGGEIMLQYGQFYEGEQSVKVGANAGFELGDNGFLNLSIEHTDNEGLSRGFQNPNAQALIDAGNTGVGQDTPFDDAPLVQSHGRPETTGTRIFINSGYEINDSAEVYALMSYADTDGLYRFFYRHPTHSSIQALVDNNGYDGALLGTGYTPIMVGEQQDYSFSGGVRGEFSNELYYDFSIGIGNNRLAFDLNNTTNPSLGLGSNGEPLQRDFYTGATEEQDIVINADFSKELASNLNFAFGFEWREESYTIEAGEFNSYIGAGSNGLKGTRPEDTGSFDRDNVAVYIDIEHEITDEFLMQYALRYEDFSDFGGTLNGKIATRWNATDNLIFRGAVSTGFHAPTPGQSNIRSTITDVIDGKLVDIGQLPPTDPAAIAAGAKPLKEEESLGLSAGFVLSEGATSLSVDIFQIDVDDRIYNARDIPNPTADGTFINFYTNALNVQSKGIDVILTTNLEWSASVDTNFTFAYNYTEVEVTEVKTVDTPDHGAVIPVSKDIVDDIENNYPNSRFVLTANTSFSDDLSLMIRANYYGTSIDGRGSHDHPTTPSAKVDSVIYVDMEVNYNINDNLKVTLGASNIFDNYINELTEENANYLAFGLQYPRDSAANYDGGSWYLRTSYLF